jgi:hypothetical protein
VGRAPARPLWPSSASSQPPPASWPAICITSLSPLSHRYRPGRRCRHVILRPSTR